MNKFAKIPLMMLGGGASVFAVLLTIYFFNLDMKFMSYCVEPILLKIYDMRKPNFYV